MLASDISWDELIRILRSEYDDIYEQDIRQEVDAALAQIPRLIDMGVVFPGRLPLFRTCYKSRGKSGALFFVCVTIDNIHKSEIGSYENDFRLTVIAKVKQNGYVNCVAFTGDSDAVYWQHFFSRYLEREKKNKIQPEALYLSILSKRSMWSTLMTTFESEKYNHAYARPWAEGLALGSSLDMGGELRGTYISRDLMRSEQDILCKSLLFMGDIQRVYGYKLEENMERTMIKFHLGEVYKEQITHYFIYYWQAKRVSSFFEHTLRKYDEETLPIANRFFETYGLPIEYKRDCMVALHKPIYFL